MSEDDPTPGYDLTDLTCDDGQSTTPSTTNLGTRTATIKVDPGETVRRVVTNTKRGVLEIEKQTTPADPKPEADQDKFGFAADFPAPATTRSSSTMTMSGRSPTSRRAPTRSARTIRPRAMT